MVSTHLSTAANKSYTLYLNDPRTSPVRVHTDNYKGGFTQLDTKYDDFEGKVEETKTTHSRNTGSAQTTVEEHFYYTDQGRLDYQTHEINDSGNVERLAKNNYDPLGNITNKEVGNTEGNPLQTIDYTFNIRGWLTGINPEETGLFSFQINYNNPQEGATPLYNGNISETHWMSGSDNKMRMYKYSYDDLNRLELAAYQNLYDTNIKDTYNESPIHDKNGNITSLIRNGGEESATYVVEIDNLTYTYESTLHSNQLKSVADSFGSTQGFKDIAGNDYLYERRTSEANS